jgi:hypothetical protein
LYSFRCGLTFGLSGFKAARPSDSPSDEGPMFHDNNSQKHDEPLGGPSSTRAKPPGPHYCPAGSLGRPVLGLAACARLFLN